MPNFEVSPLDARTWLVFLGEQHWYVAEQAGGGYSVQTPQWVILPGSETHTAVTDAVHDFRYA